MLEEVQQLEGKSCPVQQKIPLYHLPDDDKVYNKLYIIFIIESVVTIFGKASGSRLETNYC